MKLRLTSREPEARKPTSDTPQHPLRLEKLRQKRDGRLIPVKNSASSRNARPKKIVVAHAGGAQVLMHSAFDMRSGVGKAYQARVDELVAHLGGADLVSAPQRTLIDHAARLRLLALLAWDELSRGGAFHNGEPRPAFDAYRRASADEREVLRTLGIERRAKPVPDLDTYLRGRGSMPRLPRTLDLEDTSR
jgi:hypothetical protein